MKVFSKDFISKQISFIIDIDKKLMVKIQYEWILYLYLLFFI